MAPKYIENNVHINNTKNNIIVYNKPETARRHRPNQFQSPQNSSEPKCWLFLFFFDFRTYFPRPSVSNRRCRRPKCFKPLVNPHARSHTHTHTNQSTRIRWKNSYVSANVIYSRVKYIDMSFNYRMTRQEDDQRERTFTTVVTTVTANQQ